MKEVEVNQPRMAAETTSPNVAVVRLPKTLIGSVALGTLLNPLNSSMIAVALVRLSDDFRVNLATVTWLISSFYLAGAVGQPLMGRLADLFGARRIFCIGLALDCLVGLLAPWAGSIGLLIGLRIVQAFGTAAAYPAGLAIFRAEARRAGAEAKPPAAALGTLSITANVSASLGPTLAGFLIMLAGWQAIFLVNVPLTILGLLAAWRYLPPDRPAGESRPPQRNWSEVLKLLDLPGVVLFSGTLASLLLFLLSLSGDALWWLLPLAPLLAVLLVVWEYRARSPFMDMRMLRANPRLVRVFGQFALVNLVFYSLFFSLPLWLEQVRGFSPEVTGLIMFPFAGLGVIMTFVAVSLINKAGVQVALLVGAGLLLLACLLLLLLEPTTPLPMLIALTVILGVPNGFQNLGLQTALYQYAPANAVGTAAGQFQTFRYIGSILSTSLLGLLFEGKASSEKMHWLGLVLTAICFILFVSAVFWQKRGRKS